MKKIIISILVCILVLWLTGEFIVVDSKYFYGLIGEYKYTFIDPATDLAGQCMCGQIPIIGLILIIRLLTKKIGINYTKLVSLTVFTTSCILLLVELPPVFGQTLSMVVFSIIGIIVSGVIIIVNLKKWTQKKVQPIIEEIPKEIPKKD